MPRVVQGAVAAGGSCVRTEHKHSLSIVPTHTSCRRIDCKSPKGEHSSSQSYPRILHI